MPFTPKVCTSDSGPESGLVMAASIGHGWDSSTNGRQYESQGPPRGVFSACAITAPTESLDVRMVEDRHEIVRFWPVIQNMVVGELRVRYQRSILGFCLDPAQSALDDDDAVVGVLVPLTGIRQYPVVSVCWNGPLEFSEWQPG